MLWTGNRAKWFQVVCCDWCLAIDISWHSVGLEPHSQALLLLSVWGEPGNEGTYGSWFESNGVSPQDPHGDLKNQNVLIVRGSLEKTAEHFEMADIAEARKLLAQCREKMYEERQKRPRPHRDNKILTAWNGQHS